jgi:hypothetical protein
MVLVPWCWVRTLGLNPILIWVQPIIKSLSKCPWGNLKKTKPRVELANSQSKIQNLKSKIGTARNLGIDLAQLGRRCLTNVAFAKRVPCTELDFGFYLNQLHESVNVCI